MQALILVDIQNDFCPGGGLEVPDGAAVVPLVNSLMGAFELVVACQDWHPEDHGSFAAQHDGKEPGEVIDLNGLEQILWPVHCVQGTVGAEFHQDLCQDRIEAIVRKGTDAGIDSYGAFFDNGHRKATGLEGYLRTREVDTVYVVGLALDYCVKFTALDAASLGFDTYVVRDACRPVDNSTEGLAKLAAELHEAGVSLVSSEDVPQASLQP